jgi:2-succinyl-5-enolpyruvyl-6-hydroxy-3-cyclohexene-1-carboxylate synthase
MDLAALARVYGASVAEVGDAASVARAVEADLAEGGLHVVIVRTDRAENVAVHDEIHAAVAAALVEGSRGGG